MRIPGLEAPRHRPVSALINEAQQLQAQEPTGPLEPYVTQLLQAAREAPTKTTTVEDKDPHRLWVANLIPGWLRWLRFIGRSDGRWSITHGWEKTHP